MPITQVLPNFRQWPEQLRARPGDDFIQIWSARLLTVGSAAITLVVLASLTMIVGAGTTLADWVFGWTMNVPLIEGEVIVLVGLSILGMIVATPYALYFETLAGDREILMNDAKWIMIVNAFGMILVATHLEIDLTPTAAFGFATAGVSLLVLVGARLAESYRN